MDPTFYSGVMPGQGYGYGYGSGYAQGSAYNYQLASQYAGQYAAQPYGQGTPSANQYDQILTAFLSQQGLTGAELLVEKAKYIKMLNDTQSLDNQMQASTWTNYKQMADSWAR